MHKLKTPLTGYYGLIISNMNYIQNIIKYVFTCKVTMFLLVRLLCHS